MHSKRALDRFPGSQKILMHAWRALQGMGIRPQRFDSIRDAGWRAERSRARTQAFGPARVQAGLQEAARHWLFVRSRKYES